MSATAKKQPGSAKYRRPLDYEDQQSVTNLMIQMGGSGDFVPLPDDQAFFRIDPNIKLTPTAHRFHAWLVMMTVGTKPGGRTPHAAWGKRDLMISDGAAYLGISLPAASKAWAELERHGIGSRGEKGQLLLNGSVPYDGTSKGLPNEGKPVSAEGKQKAKLSARETRRPKYQTQRIQQLSEEKRTLFLQREALVEELEDRAEAEAMEQVRRLFKPLRKALLNTIGIKTIKVEKEQLEGPQQSTEAKPEPIVQLTLKLPEFDFVQTTEVEPEELFVQDQKRTLYSIKTDPVQESPINTKEREQRTRVSEWDSEAEKQSGSEPQKPPTHSSNELAEFLKQQGFPILQGDPLLGKFKELATKHQLPLRSICRAIIDKIADKKSKTYSIESAGALFRFVASDLHAWIAQHEREIYIDRRTGTVDEPDEEESERGYESWDKAALQGHITELREAIAETTNPTVRAAWSQSLHDAENALATLLRNSNEAGVH